MQRSVEFVINNVTETVVSVCFRKLQYFQCKNIFVVVIKHFSALAVVILNNILIDSNIQKQPPRGVLKKSCPENMEHIYRRTPMPKSDFHKVAKQLY